MSKTSTNSLALAVAGVLLALSPVCSFGQWPFSQSPDRRLFDAIAANDIAAVRELVKKKTRLLEIRNSYQQTPLMVAVGKSKLILAKTLLELGADINAVNPNQKQTALHGAIIQKNTDAIKLLMEFQPDLNLRDKGDETPLNLAIRFQIKGDVLDQLIKKTDLTSTNKNGASYLYLACWNKRWDVAKTLIQRLDADQLNGSKLYSPINIAYTFDGESTVLQLLKRNCEIPKHLNHVSESLMTWAVRKNNLEIVKELLKRDVSIRAEDNNSAPVLATAIYHQADEIIPLLLENGADASIEAPHGHGQDLISLAITHKNSTGTIQRLIENQKDFDPHTIHRYGNYLSDAASYGSKEMVQLFLDAGTDVNFAKPHQTALMSAATRGDIQLFDYLITRGAKRTLNSQNGTTLFHFACQSGNLEFIKRELAFAKDINAQNKYGETPFYAASFSKDAQKICDFLLRSGAKPDAINTQGSGVYPTALHFNAMLLHHEQVKYLLKAGIPVDCCGKDGNRASHNLAIANIGANDAKFRSIKICEYLGSAGANFGLENEAGDTPLSLAIRAGKAFLVPYMVPSVKIDQIKVANDELLIHWASRTGDIPTLNALIRSDVNSDVEDAEGNTPLMIALKNSHLEIAEKLAKRCKNVEASNQQGETALDIAVSNGDLTVAVFLIRNGAQINVDENSGESLLHSAIWNNHLPLVEALIKHGADVNAKSKTGVTPLHRAAWNGNANICNRLIAYKADIDAHDDDGNTALYKAALRGHASVVESLLKNGADVSKKNSIGIDALQIATGQGHQQVVDLLKENLKNPGR